MSPAGVPMKRKTKSTPRTGSSNEQSDPETPSVRKNLAQTLTGVTTLPITPGDTKKIKKTKKGTPGPLYPAPQTPSSVTSGKLCSDDSGQIVDIVL